MKILAVVLCAPCIAFAQSTTYSNQYGQPVGSSTTTNGTTYYSNQYGQPIGSATSVPHTVLAAPVANGYTPTPMSPQQPTQLPILPLLPELPILK